MISITYTKQADGTWLKQGEFAAIPAEVRIACGGQPAGGSVYTLQRATEIVEEAIAKGHVKHDLYSIVATEEVVTAATEKAAKVKTPKAPKEPKAPKVAKPEGETTAPANDGPKFPSREERVAEAEQRGISELEVYVEACQKFGRTPAASAQAKYDALIAKKAAKTAPAPEAPAAS